MGAALLAAAAAALVDVLLAVAEAELLGVAVDALADVGVLVAVAVPVLAALDTELVAAGAVVEVADAVVGAAAGWDDVETVAVAPQAESATAARTCALAVSAVRRDSRCDHRGEGMLAFLSLQGRRQGWRLPAGAWPADLRLTRGTVPCMLRSVNR